MSAGKLEKELSVYEEKKSELLKYAKGKFVLIKNSEVIGTYDTQNDAIKVGIDKFGNSPFLVKKVEEFEQPQNFTSNLIRVDMQCLQ